MPGNASNNPYDNDDPNIKKIMDEMTGQAERDWYDGVKPKDIWLTEKDEREVMQQEENERAREAIEKIMHEYQQQEKIKPKSDIERLRDEMMREIRDIKKAIHTLGILLESDEPSREDLENHKTLREAYRKYKMIEALTLGKGKD